MTYQIKTDDLVYRDNAATWHPIARHAHSKVRSTAPKYVAKAGLLRAAWNAVANWLERREARSAVEGMLALDDAILRDIGLTRQDVEYASRLPLSMNAAHELKLIAQQNRKAMRF